MQNKAAQKCLGLAVNPLTYWHDKTYLVAYGHAVDWPKQNLEGSEHDGEVAVFNSCNGECIYLIYSCDW